MKLSFCMRAIKTLDEQDTEQLADAIQSYRSAGMGDRESEIAAVNDLIAAVREERSALVAAVKEQNPEAPVEERVATRASFSKANIKDITKLDGWGILTAENPGNAEPTDDPDATNARLTDELRKYLDDNEIEYAEVRGKYSEDDRPEERSFVVFAPREKIIAIGSRFGQESVLTRNGLEYMDGRRDPSNGKVEVYDTKPDAYYSRIIGEPWAFQVGIDFPEALASMDDMFAESLKPLKSGMTMNWIITNPIEARTVLGLPSKQDQKSITKREFAEALDGWRKGKIASNDYSLSAIRKLGAALASEVAWYTKNAKDSGIDWYSKKFQRAIDELAKVEPSLKKKENRGLFTLTLAITSDGTEVQDNLNETMRIYRGVRAGKTLAASTELTGGFANNIKRNLELIDGLIADMGVQRTLDLLLEPMTVADVKREMVAIGAKSPASDYPADATLPRSAVYLGPKIGAFYANLMGETGYLTMDRWWNRTINRYRGDLAAAPTEKSLDDMRELLGRPRITDERVIDLAADIAKQRQEKYEAAREAGRPYAATKIETLATTVFKNARQDLNDSPRNTKDRAFQIAVVKEAQKQLQTLGVEADVAGIQATIWYYEKELFAAIGVKGRGRISYEEAARRWARESSGPAARGAGQVERAAAAGDGNRQEAGDLFASLPGARERDATDQLAFLRQEARALGYEGVDEMLAAEPQAFMRLAEQWRAQQGTGALASLPTDTTEFKKWFGDSKVVDAEGKPLVVYHGTTADFAEFDPGRKPVNDDGYMGVGSYFIADRADAESYADMAQDNAPGAARVVEVYLSIKNPYRLPNKSRGTYGMSREQAAAWTDGLIAQGYDGVVNAAGNEWVAFRPEQIKSAIGNRGTFDSTKPDILASIDDAMDDFGDPDESYDDTDFFLQPNLERGFEDLGPPQNTETLAADVAEDMRALQAGRKYSVYEIARVGRDWLALAGDKQGFAYPFSGADTLEGVATEMSKGQVTAKEVPIDRLFSSMLKDPSVVEALQNMGLKPSKVAKSYALSIGLTERQATEMGKGSASASVFELVDGSVFLSIPLFKSGVTNGNLMYQIVGTWAANSGKRFIGDPMGLSERALFRRTENMFASALRTGQTKHLLPHPYQRDAGLRWTSGDDEFNIGSMALWLRDSLELYSKGQFLRVTDAVSGERPATMQRELDDTVADAGEYAAGGRRTTARAIITETIQRGINSGRMEFVPGGYAANLEGLVEPRSIEGEILYSLPASMGDVRNLANDLFKTERKVSWWDKTIGTQYNKAQKSAAFGKVYDSGQKFLTDVSYYANAATEFSPDVLPKMDQWTDALKGAGEDFSGRRGRNLKVASKALFDGTIEDRVWTNEELAKRGMDAKQIGMYRQMRRAINVSLDQLAVSEMHRLTRNMGLDSVRSRLMGMTSDAARNLLLQEIANLPKFSETQQEMLETVRREINEKANRIDGLKAAGYAPLMRFGKYAVEFTDDGERSFMMFETERDRNKFVRELRSEPGVTGITTGIMSEKNAELFRGLDPNALEVFGEVATLEYMDDQGNLRKEKLQENALFQQYLKLATASRSAMKRLIKRKKVAGYDEQGERVLAQFVVSNSRAVSRNLHFADMTQSAAAIPREDGDLRDEAIELVKNIQTPDQNTLSAKLRGYMFIHYLGGSIASALVNITQPVMMSFPYLSQWGTARAGAAMTNGLRQAVGKRPGGELGVAMERAENEGIVSPQEIHTLYAEASRNLAASAPVRRTLLLWGSMFSAAEQFNRRATFIAAWDVATQIGAAKLAEAGFASRYDFAVHAIAETQGTYNSGNRPNWARGNVGSVVLTFKQYSIHYLEFFNRLPRAQKVLALAMLVIASGLQGLPFADDLDDLIDAMAQGLGYAWNTKDKKRELVASVLGKAGAEIVMSGLSGIPGVPLDVQGRLSMGNLIPGSGLLKRSNPNPMRDTFDILGPAGGLLNDAIEGSRQLAAGNTSGAASMALPLALRNIAKGQDMIQTGAYRDTRGRTVVEADFTDAVIKIIGFQPSAVATVTRAERSTQELVSLTRAIKNEISEKWAEGIYTKDRDMVQEARDQLAEWNSDNPELKVTVKASDVMKRAKEKAKPRSQRIEESAPKSIRSEVARRLDQ